MSATNRSSLRVENDCYPTPRNVVDLISERIQWAKVGSVYEPCKGPGDGAILSAVPSHIAKEWAEISEGRDYLAGELPKVDLVWTNPPFSIAQEFLLRSLGQARTVVYLLRINFLGSEARRPFFQSHPPTHLYVLSKRPSFVDVCDGLTVKTTGAGGKVLETKKQKGCGWAFQKTDAVKECSNCGGRVKAGTDSIEYAWFVWDRGEIMADFPGIRVL